MCAVWAEKYDPNPILDRLKESANPFAFAEYRAVLAGRLRFREDIPRYVQRALLIKCLLNARDAGSLTKSGVEKVATDLENQYLAQPPRPYYLLTSASVRFSDDLPERRINGCQIKFLRGKPVRFDDTPIADRIRYFFYNRKIPSNYMYVRVATKGKSDIEAGEQALAAFGVLRAIWNLFENHHLGMRLSEELRPINRFLQGPISTLHDRRGVLVNERYWYESDYYAPADVREFRSWSKYAEFEERILVGLAKCRYRESVGEALRHYCHAWIRRTTKRHCCGCGWC